MKYRLSLFLGIVSAFLVLAGIYGSFLIAPLIVTPKTPAGAFSQKVFYFHVPVAETSLIAFLIAAIFAIVFLVTKAQKYDFWSHAAVEIGLLFGFLVEWTGVLWVRMEWGSWWTWEPRLTTYLVLLLVYAGYFVLRASVDEESRRARYAAVYAIMASVNAPLTFFAVRLIPSVHPVVFTSSGARMEPSMLMSFIISMFGMTGLFVILLLLRSSLEQMREEVRHLKDQLGG